MNVTRFSWMACLLGIMAAWTPSTAGATELFKAQCYDQCNSSWIFDAELMYIKPHRGDGVSSNADIGFELGHRFNLAYENNRGAGIRFGYMAFDHAYAQGHNGNLSSIDLYTFDVSVYKNLQLGCDTQVEVSGGLRISDYEDRNFSDNNQAVEFDGFGAFLGAKARHTMPFNTNGFVRGKWAVLTGEGNDNGTVERQTVRDQFEVAVGVEKAFNIGRARASIFSAYEFQNWNGYQDNTDGSLGFQGYTLGLNIRY